MSNWSKENRIEHLNYLIKVSKMNLSCRKNLYRIRDELIIEGKLQNELTKYRISIVEDDDIKQVVDVLVKNEEDRLKDLLLELEQLTS